MDGRSPRFLTRAQKCAITNESASSSSKKWLSSGTRSTRRTPASTSARMLSRRAAAAPPARSVPRQNSRPRPAVVTVSCRLILLISHLPRRVPSPPRVCRDILSLHEKGVGGEHRAITHGHAVVGERANPDRAAGTKRGSVAFEGGVLHRVALYLAAVVEHALVPDGGERPLREVDTVVEHPPADTNPHQPPEQGLERSAVENGK